MLIRVIITSLFFFLFTINAQAAIVEVVPGIVTVLKGGDAKYYVLAQKKISLNDDISIKGLPEGSSWSLLCTGSRAENCSKDYASDDLPIFTLKINIASDAKSGIYQVKIKQNGTNDVGAGFNLQVLESVKFTHPGVFIDAKMLANIKDSLEDKTSIRFKALLAAKNSKFGNITYQPHPHSLVNSDDQSGVDYREDAIAAYTQALLWYVTGNKRYADNTISIFNAWSNTLNTNLIGNNKFNLAAWTGDVWPRAAEIIRYTYLNQDESRWASSDITSFSNMLKKYTIDFINNEYFSSGNYGGNLLSSQAAAFINIGVFNNDHKTFLQGVDKWRKMLAAYIYMKNDGALPMPPFFWRNSYISSKSLLSSSGYWKGQDFNSSSIGIGGLSQETCRDIGHVVWGFTALANGLETARIQGVDLANEDTLGTKNSSRLKAGSEYNTHFYNDPTAIQSNSSTNPCGKQIALGSSVGKGEVLLNHLKNRSNLSLPETESFVEQARPTGESYFMIWETLTHYQNP